jgi:ferrous iron transport protein B
MGVRQENWPATVGLIAGVFAKEAVAGTLDSLYRREADEAEVEYSFKAGIVEAFQAVPQGFAALFGFTDEEPEDSAAQGAIREAFGSTAAVVAYLLFILVYCPCVAVIGAIYQESDMKWTVFSVAYLTLLAWVVATLFYQIAVFAQQPLVSAAWVAGCVSFLAAGAIGLRHYGRRGL